MKATPQDRLDELEKRRQKIEAMKKEREAKKKTDTAPSSPLAVRPSQIAEPKKSPRLSLTRNLLPRSEDEISNSPSKLSAQSTPSSNYDDLLRNVLDGDIPQIRQSDLEQERLQQREMKMKSLKVFTLNEWVVDVAPKKIDTINRETQTIQVYTPPPQPNTEESTTIEKENSVREEKIVSVFAR
jgi:hypothetical protein